MGLCNGIKLNIRWWRIQSETFPTRNSAHLCLLLCVLMQHNRWLLWVLSIMPWKSNWIQMQGLLSWLQRKLQWLCYGLVYSLSWKNGESHNGGKLHALRYRSSISELTAWRRTDGRPSSEPVMVTSSNGNIFRVTGPLCGEFTGGRWIPRAKASDAELWCFLWSAYE